jgi:hypothetical protein
VVIETFKWLPFFHTLYFCRERSFTATAVLLVNQVVANKLLFQFYLSNFRVFRQSVNAACQLLLKEHCL